MKYRKFFSLFLFLMSFFLLIGLFGQVSGIAEAYYSSQFLLPQSQNKQHLTHFLSTEHKEYNLDGWFFFGNLIEGRGVPKPEQVNSFFMAIQRLDQLSLFGTSFRIAIYPCIVGFNSSNLDRYIYGLGVDLSPQISVVADPWSVVAVMPLGTGGHPSMLSMTLVKGKMGTRGAVYHLSSDVEDQEGHRLQTDVLIKDIFGIINEGYGPSSFFPQWVTPEQRALIQSEYNGSLESYLLDKKNPMSCQGSYYYSAPRLKVLDFKITRDYNEILAEGKRGTLWMDYLVQTYNDDAKAVVDKCSWFFADIQLNGSLSMMLFELKTKTSGTLPVAKIFRRKRGERNGSVNSIYSWDIDKVNISPVAGSEWESPASHVKYNMEYTVNLTSDNKKYNGTLTITMLRNNQEICIPTQDPQYEGVATVVGILGGRKVKGYAWVEIKP